MEASCCYSTVNLSYLVTKIFMLEATSATSSKHSLIDHQLEEAASATSSKHYPLDHRLVALGGWKKSSSSRRVPWERLGGPNVSYLALHRNKL